MKTLLTALLLTLTTATLTAQTADCTKMSPLLADKMTTAAAARSTNKAATEEEYVLALVKTADTDDDLLADQSCVVIDRIGRISIALLPVSRLAPLAADDRILRMEANPLSETLTDVTPGAVNALPAYLGQNLPQAYTGRGVVVGVCDVGLDFCNPMFMDADGHTRIRQAWDIYTGATTGYAGIGTLYTTPDSLAAARGTCDSTKYHGTHVAAIAAGSAARNGRYRGIAYEADIVMSLAFLSGYTDEQRDNLYRSFIDAISRHGDHPVLADYVKKRITLTSAMEALAIKHVMDYATAHNQPCVVNCSFGSQQNLTDDDSVKEELLNSLTGPGRIIVCSAGNYGDGTIYKMKPAGQRLDDRLWLRSSLTPSMTLRSSGDFTLKLVPHIDGADTLCITAADIRLKSGRRDSAAINGKDLQGDWMFTQSRAYTNAATGQTAYAIDLTLPANTKAYLTPSVAIVIEGDATEVMGKFRQLTFNRLRAGSYADNAPYTVCVPAAFTEMIAVGLTSHRDSLDNLLGERVNYDYNNNAVGQVVSWSGSGPTLEGRMKPDVVAPGHNIVSALNSNTSLESLTDRARQLLADSETTGDKTYYWKIESGTSMSAPVVTGVIALWLQANPQLTPDDVKQILAMTARHPEAGIAYPNYRYGHGEIDAYSGLLHITGLSAVEGLSAHGPQKGSFRLDGRTLVLDGMDAGATVTVYSLSGRVVMRTAAQGQTVDLTALPAGIYAVQADTGQAATTGSTLIRLE